MGAEPLLEKREKMELKRAEVVVRVVPDDQKGNQNLAPKPMHEPGFLK
jgi:hypothetical protein